MNKSKRIQSILLIFICGLWMACSPATEKQEEEIDIKNGWRSLFNGEDMDNWRIKISKHELG